MPLFSSIEMEKIFFKNQANKITFTSPKPKTTTPIDRKVFFNIYNRQLFFPFSIAEKKFKTTFPEN